MSPESESRVLHAASAMASELQDIDLLTARNLSRMQVGACVPQDI